MPLGLWNIEWLNLNGQRKYPLADDASAVSSDGGFTVPDDFIVELDLAVHSGMDVTPGNFFIQTLSAYGTGFMVVVGYQPASGGAVPVPVATATIASQFHTRNKVYALGGIAPFDDAVGKIAIGRLDNVQEQAAGMFAFTFPATRLDPDAVRPLLRGVSSIVVVNNGQRSRPIYGDVELVAGSNVQIVPTQVAGQMPRIRFDAISGVGLIDPCACVGADAVKPPIRTINGIAPSAAGDFVLAGDKCIAVAPVSNGVRLSDTCAKPCCGCAELEVITRELETLKAEAEAITQFANKLDSATAIMSDVVLGAKIGGGCP
jgi:hypothetical protein